MINEILKQIIKLVNEELDLDVSKRLANVTAIKARDFIKETGLYLNVDFIAGYLFYNSKDYILLNEYTFPDLKETRKKSVLFHECMHLASTKVSKENHDVGFVFRKINFININEGLNEIATNYFFERAYVNEKYVYVKAYNLDRKICNYLISYMYKDMKDFLKSYILESPYFFYKRLYYTFDINNLIELKKAIKNIHKERYRCENIDELIKRNIRLRLQS